MVNGSDSWKSWQEMIYDGGFAAWVTGSANYLAITGGLGYLIRLRPAGHYYIQNNTSDNQQ